MFQQTWSIEIVVARTIGDLPADGRFREWLIVCVLPAHLEWCEVPVVTAGYTRAVGVRLLMTTGAIQTRHAFAFWSTHDVRDVTVSIVALLRIVGGGVTVNAARRRQDGVHLVPRGETLRRAVAVYGPAVNKCGDT
jgi:hypothetical protein